MVRGLWVPVIFPNPDEVANVAVDPVAVTAREPLGAVKLV
jgi:hypothetical protein